MRNLRELREPLLDGESVPPPKLKRGCSLLTPQPLNPKLRRSGTGVSAGLFLLLIGSVDLVWAFPVKSVTVDCGKCQCTGVTELTKATQKVRQISFVCREGKPQSTTFSDPIEADDMRVLYRCGEGLSSTMEIPSPQLTPDKKYFFKVVGCNSPGGSHSPEDLPDNPFILLESASPPIQTTCISPPLGLVSWLSGDGSGRDIIGGNDGILNGTTFEAGKVGQAFSFDGLEDVVSTPLIFSYGGGATFEAWLKTTDDSGAVVTDGGGASAERGMGVFLDSGRIHLFGDKGTPDDLNFFIEGPVISDAQFHHVAGTWTGNTVSDGVKLYVDGEVVGSATALAQIDTGSTAISIGGHELIDHPKYAGLIDEVGLYSRALAASEIESIFNAGSAGKCLNRNDFTTAVQGAGSSTEIAVAFVQNATILAPASVSAVFWSQIGEALDTKSVVLTPNATASLIFGGNSDFEVGHIETVAGPGVVVTEIINLSIQGVGNIPPIGVGPSSPCKRPVAILKRNAEFDTGVALSSTTQKTATCEYSIYSGPDGDLIGSGVWTVHPFGQFQDSPLNDDSLPEDLPLLFDGNIQYECDIPVHAISLFQRKKDGALFSNAVACAE